MVTENTLISEAFAPSHRPYTRLIAALGQRGAYRMHQLRNLSLAEWWRAAREDFSRLVHVAAAAGVCPRDVPNAGVLRRAAAPPDLYNGLVNESRAQHTARALAREGVSTHLLASRLTRADLLKCINDGQLTMVTAYLTSKGIRLAG